MTHDHARRHNLNGTKLCRVDRAFSVQRLTNRIDNPTEKRVTNRNLSNPARCTNLSALSNRLVVAQDNGSDRVLLEVQGHAEGAVAKVQQLTSHCLRQPVNPGDAVANFDNRTHIRRTYRLIKAANLVD